MSPSRQNAVNARASCSGVTAMPCPNDTDASARVLFDHSSARGMMPALSLSTPMSVLSPKRHSERHFFISPEPMRNATVAMPAFTDFTSTCSQVRGP